LGRSFGKSRVEELRYFREVFACCEQRISGGDEMINFEDRKPKSEDLLVRFRPKPAFLSSKNPYEAIERTSCTVGNALLGPLVQNALNGSAESQF